MFGSNKQDALTNKQGCVLIFSCENSKNATRFWTAIDRRMLDPSKKDAPCPRAKEKPQQESRRGDIAFRIKPHTRLRCLEGSNKTLCAPGPREPTETEPDPPLSVWVSPEEAQISCGAAGTGALAAADLEQKLKDACSLEEKLWPT